MAVLVHGMHEIASWDDDQAVCFKVFRPVVRRHSLSNRTIPWWINAEATNVVVRQMSSLSWNRNIDSMSGMLRSSRSSDGLIESFKLCSKITDSDDRWCPPLLLLDVAIIALAGLCVGCSYRRTCPFFAIFAPDSRQMNAKVADLSGLKNDGVDCTHRPENNEP